MGKCIRPWEYFTIHSSTVDTGNARLNRVIDSKVSRIEKAFQKDAEELIADMASEPVDPSRYTLDISTRVVSTGALISVVMDVYTYLGGAHSISESYTWNYETQTGRLLRIVPQILTRADLTKVAKNIESTLLQKDPERFADDSWLREGLSPKRLANYRVGTVSTDAAGTIVSITFYFADYQLGPHAIGRPEITIDAKTLQVLSFK